jgi:hypothetical protein
MPLSLRTIDQQIEKLLTGSATVPGTEWFHADPMAISLSQKIRELKGLADEGELDGDDLEFIERVNELTGNGGAATLLSEAEARRVDELYRALGG